MLPIALLALGRLIYSHWVRSASTHRRWLAKGALAAAILPLAFFAGAGLLGGLPSWPMNRQLSAYRKTLVTFINVVPETEQLTESVFPWPERVKTAVNVLNRIGYRRPPLIRSNFIGDIASGAGEKASGEFQFNEGEAGWINASGWAFLAKKRRPADAILITYDNAVTSGKPLICAITSVESSYQVAPLRAVWDVSTLPSTWRARFSRDRLPKGQHCHLEAWAFNADENRAYRLPGGAFFLW